MNETPLRNCPSAAFVNETNGLTDGFAYHAARRDAEDITLAELAARGGRITRLRILSDPGSRYADVSYCHGELPDGTPVRIINAPLGISYYRLKHDLVEWAKEEGVFAKGLGLLNEANWSVLR